MDPITAAILAGLTALSGAMQAAISFESKIWDSMPKDQQAVLAGDTAKILHNFSVPLIDATTKMNQLVEKLLNGSNTKQ